MNSDAQREAALFQAAAELTSAARATFLDGACHGNPALRSRLEALLAADSQTEGLLAEPAPVAKATMKLELADTPDEAVGQTLGRYKLLERVGEGGCGVVYVAEQTVPVRRRVALKVIKLGMDTKQVVARFEAERQALAMMDHPNIAKVLDAGTTDVGRPFFVMELVRGIRITEYCDQANLSTKERLDLFIKVCHAIQHAHQKGIIHRDIKPSNILVTLHDGVPVPKVIDFGIAKATEGRLTDNTVYTQLHQFIGTPAYMSPEQAEMSGLDIDTRSDIYSLGVLLYELLAGSTPFDGQELMASGIDQMRKTIRDQEPQRPSTRFATLKGEQLTTTAKRRSADSSKLMHQIQGDLDWIVMKCLEKDRTRRYETANGLAFDLKRHLSNEPVLARPPSTAYKFQKAFRRNKVAFTAGVAVAAALLIGIIVSTWQSVRATHAKRDALSAQAGESVQRQKAEANEQQAIAARQRAYAADMNVAKHALEGHNLGRALDLLKRQVTPGQKDLRGWEWRYLWQQTHSDATFTLCQESAEISSLAVSPDGNLLAMGVRHEGGLVVWDLRTRQELIRLAKNESEVRAAFSPTEPLLAFVDATFSAAAPEQDTLHLWNTATRQMMADLPLGGGRCMGLAFAKDGRTLVTSTIGGHITIWRVPEGIKLASYDAGGTGFNAGTRFAATPDLSLAAYMGEDTRVRVIDLHDGGKELWTATDSNKMITALAFSPDGKTLATAAGSSESDIRLWEVATGRQIGRPLEGHGSWVSSLVFWPDGKKLASSSADQTIHVWDVAGRKCVDVLRGHRQEVWRLALLPDDKTLVSGGKDGTVCFWDTSVTHPHQSVITLPVENIASWNFAPDGRSMLTLNQQGQVMQWTGDDFRQRQPLLETGTSVSPFSSCFSPDGRLLAVCWTNGIVQVWNPSQRVLLHQLTNTTGEVWPQTFLADGKRLITWSESGKVLRELNLTTGKEIQSWQAPIEFSSALLTPDKRSCIALGWEGGTGLRNLADGSQTELKLDTLEVSVGAFSPNGKLFAAASALGFARVWDTAAWKPVATLGSFLNGVHGVNFSPDGQRLAISSHGKGAVRLCDTESWQDVFTLEAGGGFGSTAFSPDGNTLVWGSTAGVYLWRAPSWAEIAATEAKEKAESRQP